MTPHMNDLKAEDSLGMQMIYNLAQYCKSWLDDNNVDKREIQRRQQEEQLQKKRAEGLAVNAVTFSVWKEKFYGPKLLEERRIELEKRKRPTGRQLFESSVELASSDTSFVDEEGGGEAVEIDWSVFSKEMEDIDIEKLT